MLPSGFSVMSHVGKSAEPRVAPQHLKVLNPGDVRLGYTLSPVAKQP